MYKSAKHLFLLGIIVASSVVSAISMPQTASAATASLYLPDKIKTEAKQNALRNSLALCTTYRITTIADLLDGALSIGKERDGIVSQSDLASGSWFYTDKHADDYQLRIGYLVQTDDGQIPCKDLFAGRNVPKELGFTGYTDMACKIGFVRTNGSDCVTGGGNYSVTKVGKQDVFDAIKASVGVNGYNNAQLYALAAATYITACKGKAVVNLADATTDQKNDTDKYDQIKVVTGTGTIIWVLYTKENNGGKAFRNLTDGDFTPVNKNCEWMKDRMNEYADEYAAWVKNGNLAPNGDQAGTGIEEDESVAEENVSCTVEGIGWVICPVVTFLAAVADGAYAGVEVLLVVPPLSTDTSSGTFSAWAAMRDIANIAFVIVFLIIVFSQLTSIGINNYGIKKMLPRLILAAVLVNASYWICAIAVDVSNIVGSSLKGVLDNIGAGITSGEGATGWNGLGGWQGVAGAITAGVIGAAILYAAVGTLLPALITAAFAIAMVFIVLSARQALILLWVVVAPLAFVAYLLPNTETFFKKWWSIGKTLLLLYAVIALLFGASALASEVILQSAGSDVFSAIPLPFGMSPHIADAFQTVTSTAGFNARTTIQSILIVLMAGVIRVVPLFITPFAIKTMSGAAGKLAGYVNNPNKGLVDKYRKRAEATGERINNRRQISALNGGRPGILGSGRRKQAEREAINASLAGEARRGQTAYIANKAAGDTRFQNTLAGGVNAPNLPGWVPGSDTANNQLNRLGSNASNSAMNRALAGAVNQQSTIHTEEVRAAGAVIDHLNLSSDQLNALARGESTHNGAALPGGLTGTDEITRTAAIQSAVKTGTVNDVEGIIKSADTMTRDQHKSLATSIAASGIDKKATHLGGQTLDDIAQGNVTSEADLNRVMARAIEGGKYSADKLADNDKDSLKRMEALLASPGSGGVSAPKVNTMRSLADEATSNRRITTRLSDAQTDILNRIKPAPPPPPPPTTP
jgi:hypothetical protein